MAVKSGRRPKADGTSDTATSGGGVNLRVGGVPTVGIIAGAGVVALGVVLAVRQWKGSGNPYAQKAARLMRHASILATKMRRLGYTPNDPPGKIEVVEGGVTVHTVTYYNAWGGPDWDAKFRHYTRPKGDPQGRGALHDDDKEGRTQARELELIAESLAEFHRLFEEWEQTLKELAWLDYESKAAKMGPLGIVDWAAVGRGLTRTF